MSKRKEKMYFRITIPSLQDGKKDEAISFVKDKVMPEFDGTPGLISMTAAITGETSGINMSAYESKEASDAVAEKVQATLAEAASFMAAPPVIYEGEAVFGKVYQNISKDEKKARLYEACNWCCQRDRCCLKFLKRKSGTYL